MSNFSSPRSGSENESSNMRTPEERKSTLRSFLKNTQSLQNFSPKKFKELEAMIEEADTMTLDVTADDPGTSHDEILIDSEIMTASSKVLRSATSTLTKKVSPYNMNHFAEKLLRYVHMLPDTTLAKPNWSILEAEVSTLFKRTPTFSTLSGCLEPLEKKVVVKRQVQKRETLAPTARPEAVITIDKEDDSVEKTVKKIKTLISEHHSRGEPPIEYFRLVLNPDNFGATIQNMLYIAFLVRDCFVKVSTDENGRFVIVPCSKEAKTAAKREKRNTVQNLMSLDQAQWRALIDAYKIDGPMIDFN